MKIEGSPIMLIEGNRVIFGELE